MIDQLATSARGVWTSGVWHGRCGALGESQKRPRMLPWAQACREKGPDTRTVALSLEKEEGVTVCSG